MKPLLLRRTLYLVTCAAFAACNGLSGHNYIPLTATAIYSPDSVRLAMDGGDEKAADKKLAAAIEMRKHKDTVGSIPLFKEAILLKPSAKAYFELSSPLLVTHQYDEAIQALYMAEKLGYTPLANVMFRYSYAYSCMITSNNHYGDSAIRYMQLAIQMGYAHPEEYLRREYFPKLIAEGSFDKSFSDALSGMAGKNPEKSLWESYSTQFPEVSLPLVVNLPWIKAHPVDDPISFEFEKFIPEMRDNRFSREGGNVYYYIALVKKDPAYTAVVYGTQYEGEEDGDETDSNYKVPGAVSTLTPLYYLATYDSHGKILDRMMVAGRNLLDEPFKAFSIQSNMHFQVQDFIDQYKQDTAVAGIDSANYAGIKPQTPVNYLIDATGKFIKTDVPLAAR